jgi:NAD-dependent dihydropyrimidine dehydrogenase PreA subunit
MQRAIDSVPDLGRHTAITIEGTSPNQRSVFETDFLRLGFMPKITIDRNSCTQCGACLDVRYSRDVFEMREKGPVVVHPETCRLCGHCVAVCPTDSINHEKIPTRDCPLIDPQQLPSMMLCWPRYALVVPIAGIKTVPWRAK